MFIFLATHGSSLGSAQYPSQVPSPAFIPLAKDSGLPCVIEKSALN